MAATNPNDIFSISPSMATTLGKLKKPDMVTVLCFEYAAKAGDESLRAANRLLLIENADRPHDRRSLFICSEWLAIWDAVRQVA
jgi:hypothetical protein